jgi:CO/xanthine dehydrogenase FAD-binding subunit
MDLAVSSVMRPATVEEAVRALAADPHARPIAGGTDLMVQMRDGRRRVATLVDITSLGLAGITETGSGLEIGACTPMDVIAADPRVRAAHPSLAEAAALVGAWPIQCRATLGGNVANGSPAADTAPPLLVAEAVLVVATAGGTRLVPVADVFVGPGKTALAPGDLVTTVRLPTPSAGSGRVVERFCKVGPRREQIIAVVSLAARIRVSSGVVSEARLALGSVAATPVRARAAELCLAGNRLTPALRREACGTLQSDIAPIDDVRAPASYRRIAAAVLLDRILREAADE